MLKIATSRSPSFKEALKDIYLKEIQLAEEFVIIMSTIYTKRELDADKLKSLGAFMNSKVIICIKFRAENAMKSHYGKDALPILTYKDLLSQLWMPKFTKKIIQGYPKLLRNQEENSGSYVLGD